MRQSSGIVAAAAFVLAGVLAGCSGAQEPAGEAPAAGTPGQEAPAQMAPSSGYQSVQVADGGRVAGTVRFSGQAAAPAALEVTKDKEVCDKVKHHAEDLLVSADQGIANVVVQLQDIHAGKGFAAAGSPRLDQTNCRFDPHVQVVPAGSTVEVYNNDGILHNIHTFSEKNPPVNKAQPKFLKKVDVEFVEPEVIRVKCDAHGWMSAWILVADHPYYAVTDGNGQFRLDEVPAGTYSVRFWHEKLGEGTGQVTVSPGGEAVVDHSYAG